MFRSIWPSARRLIRFVIATNSAPDGARCCPLLDNQKVAAYTDRVQTQGQMLSHVQAVLLPSGRFHLAMIAESNHWHMVRASRDAGRSTPQYIFLG